MRGQSMPGDDVRPHHAASEGVTGEGVAAKAAVPASAAMTTAAAICHGAGRPNRGAERNCRSERNACHLQVHESLTSLSQCFLFVGRLPRESPNCDRREHAMPLTIWFRVSVAPATRKLCELPNKQVSSAAQITNATVPDTDVSFQVSGLCYLLFPS
jgi:hypothetical protein